MSRRLSISRPTMRARVRARANVIDHLSSNTPPYHEICHRGCRRWTQRYRFGPGCPRIVNHHSGVCGVRRAQTGRGMVTVVVILQLCDFCDVLHAIPSDASISDWRKATFVRHKTGTSWRDPHPTLKVTNDPNA
jgi:hypothetical protein